MPLLPADPIQLPWGHLARHSEMEQVPHFCFPHGVQPLLLERTPSMSALNEVIYSQQYQNSDGCSFIFLMKVGNCQECLLVPCKTFFFLGAAITCKSQQLQTCFRPSGLCSQQTWISDSCSIFRTKLCS